MSWITWQLQDLLKKQSVNPNISYGSGDVSDALNLLSILESFQSRITTLEKLVNERKK